MQETFYRRLGKRWLDLAFSALGIVLASPLLLLTAVLVKITSSGPVIYRHRRVGLDGLTFDVLKFRTMIRDTDKTGLSLSTTHENRSARMMWGPVVLGAEAFNSPMTTRAF